MTTACCCFIAGCGKNAGTQQKSAGQGAAKSQYNGNVPQSANKDMDQIRKSAEQGDAKAQFMLGGIYYSGQGVTQDYGEAMKWYLKAADQGNADAQFLLGVIYFNGQGVTKDTAEALKWLRKSAAQGKTAAINLLRLWGPGAGASAPASASADTGASAKSGDYTPEKMPSPQEILKTSDYILAQPGIGPAAKYTAYRGRANAWILLNDMPKALGAINDALQVPGIQPIQRAQAYSIQGDIYVRLNNWASAINSFTSALNTPGLDEFYEDKINFLYKRAFAKTYQGGDFAAMQSMVSDLHQILKFPESQTKTDRMNDGKLLLEKIGLLASNAGASAKSGDYTDEDRMNIADAILARDDVDPKEKFKVYVGRAKDLSDLGKKQEALADLASALKIQGIAAPDRAGAQAQACVLQGDIDMGAKNWGNAIINFTKALNTPGLPEYDESKILVLCKRAAARAGQGQGNELAVKQILADLQQITKFPDSEEKRQTLPLVAMMLEKMGLPNDPDMLAKLPDSFFAEDTKKPDAPKKIEAPASTLAKPGTPGPGGQGDADAQYKRGVLYANGNGVTKDYAEAVKCFRKAADQGHAGAQVSLGGLYYSGQGVTKDYAEAMKWYLKAANQGNASAQFMLGLLYFNGQGTSRDSAEALKWFRKSAAQGDANAKAFLEQTGLGAQSGATSD